MDTIKVGTCRVNDTDYGRIVIERYGYYNMNEPGWAVPAWDEEGHADLCGPFVSVVTAEQALMDEAY